LPEKILPRTVLDQPPPGAAATARWSVLLRLRQHRLAWLKRAELALVADAVQPVQVADGPLLHCLHADAPLFGPMQDAPSEGAPLRDDTLLIAPLDPLIYDRRVTRQVWDFDYTWEVYTPPAKRVRGYYALPILAGHALVGHVDPKADRPAGRLRIISRRVQRGHTTTPAIRDLARFLGLRA
jgi:uncharacterized protein YcaQ